ncbi:MAG: GMP synthase, partial [Thalassobaculaceae bacterium]
MQDTVLLIVHQKKSVPGHIGHLFDERGYKFDRRCPCLGDELPKELDSYAAVVIFGGPMSANDCWM